MLPEELWGWKAHSVLLSPLKLLETVERSVIMLGIFAEAVKVSRATMELF